jgi:hypothetical protein
MLTQNKKLHFGLKSGILTLFIVSFGIAFSTLPQQTDATWTGLNCTWSGGPGTHLTVTAGAPCVLTGSETASAITVNSGATLNIGKSTEGGNLTGIASASILGTVNVIEDVDGTLDESYIQSTGSITLVDNGQLNIDQKASQANWSSAVTGLSIDSSLGNNATFNLQGGQFDAGVSTTVYYTSTGPNLVVGSGATFTSDALYTHPTNGGGEIINDGTFNITKAAYQIVTLHPGTQVTNNGIFNIESTANGTDFYIKNGATVTNNPSGTFNVKSATSGGFINNEAGGTLVNDGIFDSEVRIRNYGTFTSSNTFDIGTLAIPKDFTVYNGATVTTSGTNDFTVWGSTTMQTNTTWNNTGSVVAESVQIDGPNSTLTNSGDFFSNSSITLGNTGGLNGEIIALGGSQLDADSILVRGDGYLDVQSGADVDVNVVDLVVSTGGTVNNAGTINVNSFGGQYTRINGATSSFNNSGLLETSRLYVGGLPNEGGTYTNTGTTNITEATSDVLNIYAGEIYNNNTSPATSFSWAGRAWISGISDANQGVFENSGVVKGGESSMTFMNFGKLDLKNSANSRFVLNNSGCAPFGDPEIGRIGLSGSDAAHTAQIEIEDGAALSFDSLNIGGSPTSVDSVVNNGLIKKINTSGDDLNCPIYPVINGDSTLINNKDIDIHEGEITMWDTSTVTNNIGGSIVGEDTGLSQIAINDVGADITNFGFVDLRVLLMGFQPGGHNGGTYTGKNGSINDFRLITVGDTGVTGGHLILEANSNPSIGDLEISNAGIVDIDSTINLDLEELRVVEGAVFTNDSTLTVTGDTKVYDDGTTFTNDGTFDTYRLFVGTIVGGGLDGGDYINNGITNVTLSSGGAGIDSVYVYDGSIINNNADLGVVSFSYDGRLWIEGTVVE